MKKTPKRFAVYYKGEPFRCGFQWYEMHKKRWEYTTKKGAINAIKYMRARMNGHLISRGIKELWEKIDFTQFEIVEMGIINREPVSTEVLK